MSGVGKKRGRDASEGGNGGKRAKKDDLAPLPALAPLPLLSFDDDSQDLEGDGDGGLAPMPMLEPLTTLDVSPEPRSSRSRTDEKGNRVRTSRSQELHKLKRGKGEGLGDTAAYGRQDGGIIRNYVENAVGGRRIGETAPGAKPKRARLMFDSEALERIRFFNKADEPRKVQQDARADLVQSSKQASRVPHVDAKDFGKQERVAEKERFKELSRRLDKLRMPGFVTATVILAPSIRPTRPPRVTGVNPPKKKTKWAEELIAARKGKPTKLFPSITAAPEDAAVGPNAYKNFEADAESKPTFVYASFRSFGIPDPKPPATTSSSSSSSSSSSASSSASLSSSSSIPSAASVPPTSSASSVSALASRISSHASSSSSTSSSSSSGMLGSGPSMHHAPAGVPKSLGLIPMMAPPGRRGGGGYTPTAPSSTSTYSSSTSTPYTPSAHPGAPPSPSSAPPPYSVHSASHTYTPSGATTYRPPTSAPPPSASSTASSFQRPWYMLPPERIPIPNNRPVYPKRCWYFTSLIGCRHGDSCTFTHDPTFAPDYCPPSVWEEVKRGRIQAPPGAVPPPSHLYKGHG